MGVRVRNWGEIGHQTSQPGNRWRAVSGEQEHKGREECYIKSSLPPTHSLTTPECRNPITIICISGGSPALAHKVFAHMYYHSVV